MSIEAMKLALEALENHSGNYKLSKTECVRHSAAVTALRQAIKDEEESFKPDYDTNAVLLERIRELEAQLEQWDTTDMAHRAGGLSVEQEPVGYFDSNVLQVIHRGSDGWVDKIYSTPTGNYISPLYAAPPKRECTRSHPHENMDAMCELRTEIARLTHKNATLEACLLQMQNAALDMSIKHENIDTKIEHVDSVNIEPVAWMHVQGDYQEPNSHELDDEFLMRGWEQYPLYAAPPKRENELDIADRAYFAGKQAVAAECEAEVERLKEIIDELENDDPPKREWQNLTDEALDKVVFDCGLSATPKDIARAIEAKLKELNHD